MATLRNVFALLVLLCGAGAAAADEAAWKALAEPGSFAMMRHALAPGTGDPDSFHLGDCTTQRNLSDAGRAQARRVGAEIRRRGLTFDRVLSSQWCRCRETAELLGLGPVEDFAALNSLYHDPAQDSARTEAVRRRMMAEAGTARYFLVTHQFNIRELTGDATRSGEIVVLRLDPAGKPVLLGSIAIPAHQE